jgi:thymidylate synthase
VVLLLFILCGESRLLVSWSVGDRCDMMGRDDDLGRRRRPGVEDRRWSSTGRILSGRTIRRSGDIVCGLHHAPVSWFGLKTKVAQVSQFGPQN